MEVRKRQVQICVLCATKSASILLDLYILKI